MTAFEDERRIAELTYEAIWKIDRYREASPGRRAAPRACARLRMKAGDTLIDYGCGTGLAALWFVGKGLSVIGVDITRTALNQEVASLIDKLGHRLEFVEACLWGDDRLSLVPETDWAFCADVMEHVPEHLVNMVLENIFWRTRKGGFFNTSNGDDCFGPMIGRELHPTKRKPRWWKRKLSEWFDVVHDEPGDRETTWSFYVRTR